MYRASNNNRYWWRPMTNHLGGGKFSPDEFATTWKLPANVNCAGGCVMQWYVSRTTVAHSQLLLCMLASAPGSHALCGRDCFADPAWIAIGTLYGIKMKCSLVPGHPYLQSADEQCNKLPLILTQCHAHLQALDHQQHVRHALRVRRRLQLLQQRRQQGQRLQLV